MLLTGVKEKRDIIQSSTGCEKGMVKMEKQLIRRGMSLLLSVLMFCSLAGCGTSQMSNQEALTKQTDETGTAKTESVADTKKEAESETEVVQEDTVGTNLLENGDFSRKSEHWATFITKGGVGEFQTDDGMGVLDIISSGTTEYSNQVYYDGFSLKMGGEYEFSFDMSSTIERNAEARIQINGGDYSPYIDEFINVGPDMQTYSFSFKMEKGTDPAPRLCFNLGTPKGENALEKHTVTIDNVCVKLTDASNIIQTKTTDESVDCNTNQVGFLPKAKKTVIVRGENPGTSFVLTDSNGKTVYNGTLSTPLENENSMETVCMGDFSDFSTPGTYTVKTQNGAVSYSFKIDTDVYQDLLMDSFHMLYLQRCGSELQGELAGDFSHPACHTTKAVIYGTNQTKDVSGGWHDAGDYGRYVVTGVETAQDLLLAYEDYPQIWNGKNADLMNIPESGNGIPDILDEVRYELDWLLKMQDKASGGVYHKVTCKEFPGFVMPQDETEELVLSPISTTATGDFAAIMAKSSSVYRTYDSQFADTCLKAAKDAWKYLEKVENIRGFRNPEDILTGEYADGQDKDERFFAAAELYRVTKDPVYQEYLESTMEKYILQGYGWKEMGSYGNIAYLSCENSMINQKYIEKMEQAIIDKADKLLETAENDGYHVALDKNGYIWGSNMLVCNQARQLLFAEKLTGNKEYGICAYEQLQYLLGENPLSYCFITGYGSLTPEHAHHRPSIAMKQTMKGMLVGGPDSGLEDPFVKSTMENTPPALCYADNEQSYSTNETTIYWNSPFIYLLSEYASTEQ